MDQIVPTSPPTAIPPQSPRKKNTILLASCVVIGLMLICSGFAYYLGTQNTLSHSSNLQPGPLSTNQSLISQTPSSLPATSVILSSSTTHTDVLDPHSLPLGDNKVSTSPKSGYIYSCQTTFTGGGASENGSWIHGTSWDDTEKISVQGSVDWPNAQFNNTIQGNQRIITGNGLPLSTKTGTFPIISSDPAYQIDKNPNSIQSQTISLSLPANPTLASSPSCTPGGMIGIALNGVAIFNGLDAGGRDAVAHEVQDSCGGHPQQEGEYHYHGLSSCIPNETANNTLIGYAIDGFGIYSRYDQKGKEITDADLDECHGTTSQIMWDGKEVNMYHYVITREYPYSIGCFRGTPLTIPHTPSSSQTQGSTNHQAPPMMHPL